MDCKFIDRYKDKIYTGSLSFLDRLSIGIHMKKCGECRTAFDAIQNHGEDLKKSMLSSDIPGNLLPEVMKNINENRYKAHRVVNLAKHLTAAVSIILLLAIIPAFYLSFIGIINIPGLSPIIKNAGTLLNIGQSEAGIKNKVKGFIIKYDWEPSGGEYIQKVTIPQTFSVTPGDFPTGLYWAYVNVLSKDAGLDISNYKGSEATAHIVPLSNKFGDGPNQDVRAVVIENGGNILGGWIDGGRNGGPYVSLNRKYFGDIIEKSWGQWLIDEGISNYSKGYGADLLKLSPEDVIRKYYEAVDKKDYKTAHSMEAMSSQFSYLWMNMDDNVLFNDNFGDDLSNITSAKVKDIKLPFDPSEVSLSRQLGSDKLKHRMATDIRVCQVTIDMNFKQESTSRNGENVRFVTLVKETSDSPWQIDSIGTGP